MELCLIVITVLAFIYILSYMCSCHVQRNVKNKSLSKATSTTYPVFLQTDQNGNLSTFDFKNDTFQSMNINGNVTSVNGDLKTSGGNLCIGGTCINETTLINLLKGQFRDTRNVNDNPSIYLSKGPGKYNEFKLCSTIKLNGQGTYAYLETIVPWTDLSSSDISVRQIAYTGYGNIVSYRASISNESWGTWYTTNPQLFTDNGQGGYNYNGGPLNINSNSQVKFNTPIQINTEDSRPISLNKNNDKNSLVSFRKNDVEYNAFGTDGTGLPWWVNGSRSGWLYV